MFIALGVLTSLSLVSLSVIWRWKGMLDVAFLEGRRAGLKQAIEAAKERGDVAVLVAPAGMLTDGLQRAQTANQIEMDVRDLLARAH